MKPVYPLLLTAIILLAGCNDKAAKIPAAVRPVSLPELSKLDSEAQGKLKFACTSLMQIQSGEQSLPTLSELANQYEHAGRLLHAYDMLDQAAVCYNNAILLDPQQSLSRHYLLAHVHRKTNNAEAAVTHFNEAAQVYAKLDRKQPELLKAIYYYLGDTHLALHQLEQAEAAFTKALELKETAIARWGLGKVLLIADTPSAITQFQAAMQLNPAARNVHYSLMMAYNKLGNRRRAKFHQQEFDQGGFELYLADPLLDTVEDLKDTSAALRARGDSALFTYGDFPTAVKHYTAALEKAPQDTSLHLNLGLAKLRMNHLTEAAGHFEDTLDIEPENSRALTNLGLIAVAQNDLPRALSLVERAVLAEPNNHGMRQQYAQLLVANEQAEKAIEHLQAIIQRSPANQEALTLLIFCLLSNEDFSAADMHLDTALAIFDNDQELMFYGVFSYATNPNTKIRNLTRAKSLLDKLNKLPQDYAEGFFHAGQAMFDAAVKSEMKLEQMPNLERYQNKMLPVLLHYSRL